MINFLNLSKTKKTKIKNKNKNFLNSLHVKTYPIQLCIITQIQVFNNSFWGEKEEEEEDAFSW